MKAIRPAVLTCVLAGVVGIAGPGCSAPPDTVEADSSAGHAPWYLRSRAMDLTGDGSPDSVRLQAHGTRPDSLRIALVLLVEGEEKHREEWGSSYELALVDSAARSASALDELLRARLDSVLARVEVERMDAPGVRLMAEDSAILARLVPRPEQRISASYGYETTARMVWDAPRNRFVRLWSCC